MNIHSVQAYLLHKRSYRETSLLLDVFSKEHGRLSAILRGAKRGKARHTAIEPFKLYTLELGGRTDLKTVRSIEPGGGYMAADFPAKRLYSAMYLNELLYKLLAIQDACAAVFSAYEDALYALHIADDFELHLRNFELRLLMELGYGVDFQNEYEAQREITADKRYKLIPGSGFVESKIGSGGEQDYAGSLLLAIAEGQWDSHAARIALKSINKRSIAHHLHGEPLRTRAYFR